MKRRGQAPKRRSRQAKVQQEEPRFGEGLLKLFSVLPLQGKVVVLCMVPMVLLGAPILLVFLAPKSDFLGYLSGLLCVLGAGVGAGVHLWILRRGYQKLRDRLEGGAGDEPALALPTSAGWWALDAQGGARSLSGAGEVRNTHPRLRAEEGLVFLELDLGEEKARVDDRVALVRLLAFARDHGLVLAGTPPLGGAAEAPFDRRWFKRWGLQPALGWAVAGLYFYLPCVFLGPLLAGEAALAWRFRVGTPMGLAFMAVPALIVLSGYLDRRQRDDLLRLD